MATPFPDETQRQKDLTAKLHVIASEQQERLARRQADELGLPYISLVTFPINSEVLEVIPKEQAAAAQAVLFYKQGKDVRLAAVNPTTAAVQEIMRALRQRYGEEPQVYVTSQQGVRAALARYRREKEMEAMPQDVMHVSSDQTADFAKALDDLKELGKRITTLPPTEVLNAIIIGAVRMSASDIHIEPKEREARLRYRVDGVLQDITTFERDGWSLVLSRVKVLAKLKLNVHDVPQDGSFVLRIGPDTYDMRVSVLPGGFGENIVIRLLNRQAEALTLPELGMKQRDYEVVNEELKRTNGMILVTGPTGSGKTTTLASFIREVSKPELKVITLEDPIEYRLPGVEQTQVDADAGYTFAAGLRSILRQDPDVILVGEMRDQETAQTAVHAALTGHLVFSTLHTNNAAGAVPRLVDMGIKPFVLAPALNLIIAQRLVRVVCRECAEQYKPSAQQLDEIREVMEGVSAKVFETAVLQGKGLRFLKAKGCTQCGGTGYRGRQGVFEIFSVQGAMKQLVLEGAAGVRIQNEALKQGMTTIAQDAYLKVIEHITTVEEVKRISEE